MWYFQHHCNRPLNLNSTVLHLLDYFHKFIFYLDFFCSQYRQSKKCFWCELTFISDWEMICGITVVKISWKATFGLRAEGAWLPILFSWFSFNQIFTEFTDFLLIFGMWYFFSPYTYVFIRAPTLCMICYICTLLLFLYILLSIWEQFNVK